MFFEDNNGCSYPVSRIRKVPGGRWQREPQDQKNWRGFTVVLDNGDAVYVDAVEREKIFVGAPVHVWPAQPGTYAIYSGSDYRPASASDVWPTPVIGWALTSDGVRPITVDGLNDGLGETQTILFPNGNVTAPEDRSWRSLEEWVNYQHEVAAKLAEKPE